MLRHWSFSGRRARAARAHAGSHTNPESTTRVADGTRGGQTRKRGRRVRGRIGSRPARGPETRNFRASTDLDPPRPSAHSSTYAWNRTRDEKAERWGSPTPTDDA